MNRVDDGMLDETMVAWIWDYLLLLPFFLLLSDTIVFDMNMMNDVYDQ
jgi:hypothetical protein